MTNEKLRIYMKCLELFAGAGGLNVQIINPQIIYNFLHTINLQIIHNFLQIINNKNGMNDAGKGLLTDGVTRGLKALWRWESEGYVLKK